LELEKSQKARPADYLKLVIGFILVGAGGHFMVKGAVSLAEAMGISQWVIGVTIVAAGTSLPELITCLVASLKKKNDILLGNLVGSDIFNFAGVLGLTCVIKPIETSASAPASMISLTGMVILVMIFMKTGYRIGRFEGLTLILVATARWILDFTMF
ncbi:MAG: sodium:calcium antiporter, partial [Desulfonatronovibrionaceae bacterium]